MSNYTVLRKAITQYLKKNTLSVCKINMDSEGITSTIHVDFESINSYLIKQEIKYEDDELLAHLLNILSGINFPETEDE